MKPSSEAALQRKIRTWTMLFILGLLLSGVTAIPLVSELDWLVKVSGADRIVESDGGAPPWALWLVRVHTALREVAATHGFLFYGTDWLAFGHFAIAIAFVGALKDPVRNRWLYTFGMIACILVIPYAFIFGAVRGIPIWWRLIDSAFGVVGFVPLWLCARWTDQLETAQAAGAVRPIPGSSELSQSNTTC